MPERPYLVLHADLPFFSDPKCEREVQGARLLVLRCEDPRQTHRPIECMPSSKTYHPGQTVAWDLNNKKMWETAWYRNPGTRQIEKAWSQSVEFVGSVVRAEEGGIPDGG